MTDARGRTEPPPARHDPPPAPRALIVEDEPALLRALRINLRARGSQVVGAALEPRPPDPARPAHLLTEPGMGYRYQP